MKVATVYNNHNNVIELKLTEDGSVYPLTDITRVTVRIKNTVIDSADTPGAFDWAESEDVLTLRFGGLSLPVGTYKNCNLVVYSLGAPNGIVWVDNLQFVVK